MLSATDTDPKALRSHTRYLAQTRVRVDAPGLIKTVLTSDVSGGGLFAMTPTPPKAGAPVSLSLHVEGTAVPLLGKVVRVVEPDVATDLNPAGAGVELVAGADRSPALSRFLDALEARHGRPYDRAHICRDIADRALAATTFTHAVRRGDLYAALGAPKDAPLNVIRGALAEHRMRFATPRAAAPAARATIETAARLLVRTRRVMLNPMLRLTHDVQLARRLGNTPDPRCFERAFRAGADPKAIRQLWATAYPGELERARDLLTDALESYGEERAALLREAVSADPYSPLLVKRFSRGETV